MASDTKILNYILIFELPQWGEILNNQSYYNLCIECCNMVVNYIYHHEENTRRANRHGNLEEFMIAMEYEIPKLSEVFFRVPFSHGDYDEISRDIEDMLLELYMEFVHNEPGHFLAHEILQVAGSQVWLKVSSMEVSEDLLEWPKSTRSMRRRISKTSLKS